MRHNLSIALPNLVILIIARAHVNVNTFPLRIIRAGELEGIEENLGRETGGKLGNRGWGAGGTGAGVPGELGNPREPREINETADKAGVIITNWVTEGNPKKPK